MSVRGGKSLKGEKVRRRNEMKKSNILSAVASVLIVVWGGISGLASLVVGWLLDLLAKKTNDENETPYFEKRQSETIEQMARMYGDPDDIIIVNATRANETDGAVLVYQKERFLVAAGVKVHFSDIVEITFHNDQHVYAMPDYVVVITTHLKDHETICLSAGQDVEWAGNVVAEIKEKVKW